MLPETLSIKSRLVALLLLMLFALLSNFLSAQVTFEKGYFIDNNNTRTECLIKNYEWKNSPKKIEYKYLEYDTSFTASINEIREFSVGQYKYKRLTVQIDQSSRNLQQLNDEREPDFVEETLFLQLVIEGAASLYYAGNQKLYFYSLDDSKVVQLIYKEFLSKGRVMQNKAYRTQLWENMGAECLTIQDIDKLDYNMWDLIKVFERYNTCVNSDFINYQKNAKKASFNLGIRPGLKVATLSIENSYNSGQNIDFGSSPGFRFGLDMELTLPFNKSKWAVFFEPTYQYYKKEEPRPNYNNTADYKSIELPIGIRYSMFISKRSKLSLSAGFMITDIPIQSSIGSLEVNSTNNIILGLGYTYNKKYNIEVRYDSPRSVLANYAFYQSRYQSVSIVLGYYILNRK